MCTRNFDPLKDWSEKDKKRVMDYLKGKVSDTSGDNADGKSN